MAKLLIKGGIIISMDRMNGDYAKGDVLNDGEIIVKIGRNLSATDAKTIDVLQGD